MSEAPPTRDQSPTPAVGAGPGMVGVVVVVLVAVLAGTMAATVGPQQVLRPEQSLSSQPDDGRPAPEEPSGESGNDGEAPPAEESQGETPGWVLALGRLTQLGVLAAIAYFVLRWLLRQRLRFRRRRTKLDVGPPPEEFEVLEEDPEVVAQAIAAAASGQLAELAQGEPRNAIVACWHRFELEATEAGMARNPWETSSEFIRRVLATISADPGAVATLAALYREARFSDHPLSEPHRQRAEAALTEIHRSLQVGVGPS